MFCFVFLAYVSKFKNNLTNLTKLIKTKLRRWYILIFFKKKKYNTHT